MRLSYYKNSAGALTIDTENNYYPFGLKHQGYNDNLGRSTYNYNYNGKELQETGMYDYGARFYMPDIGRWGVADMLNSFTLDSYGYANNNPIFYNDPTGMIGESGKCPPDCPEFGDGGKARDIQEIVITKTTPATINTSNFAYYNPANLNFSQTLQYYGAKQRYENRINFQNQLASRPQPGRAMMLSGDLLGVSDIVGQLLSTVETKNRYAMMGVSLMAILATKGKAADDILKAEATVEKQILSSGEILRIENAATKINKPITVVGSRASGTATAKSDWDYVIMGLTSKEWSTIKNSIPGAKSTIDNMPRSIDIFKGKVDITKPNITINPR